MNYTYLNQLTDGQIINRQINQLNNRQIINQPLINQPITNQPILNHPLTNQPITNHPLTNQPITNHPLTNHPITNQPITNHPPISNPMTQLTNNQTSNPNVQPNKKTNGKTINEVIVKGKSSFQKDFGLILVGAIIFIASLLWKDLISDAQEKFFPKAGSFFKRFLYVFIVTMILLMFAVFIRNIFGLTDTEVNDTKLDAVPLEIKKIYNP